MPLLALFDAIGIAQPSTTGAVNSVNGIHAVRRHPEETILLGPDSPYFDTLLRTARPGRQADVAALDLSHGMAVVELVGSQLDDWLSHLVDVQGIPDRVGHASRCRLVDIAVLLLRLAPDCLWLVVDRSLCPYLANWLSFAHQGAFGHLEPSHSL